MQSRSPVETDTSTVDCQLPVLWDSTNPQGYGNRMGSYKTRIEYEFMRRHFPPAPARVLDIAGGSGRFASKLLDDGYDVTVNDIDPPSLRAVEERCWIRGPRVLPGDFLNIEIRDQFDCALAIECLDRMPFKQTIARVYRLLKQGGVFVLTVLNSASWRFAARRILGRAPHIEYVMQTHEYVDACTAAGFDILALRGFMWMPFVVNSNSPLVPVFDKVEEVLKLFSVHSQSPWLLIAARRCD